MKEIKKFIDDVKSGKKIVNKEQKQMVERYLKDRSNPKYDFKTEDINFTIKIIENTLVNIKGEDEQANTYVDKPIKLTPWQKFIIYNLLGFFFIKVLKLDALKKRLFLFLVRMGKQLLWLL